MGRSKQTGIYPQEGGGYAVDARCCGERKGRKRERLIICNSVVQDIIDAQRGRHPERVFT